MWSLRVNILASIFCVTCFSPVLVAFVLRATPQTAGAQGSDDIRTVLLRRAITVPGYEVVLIHLKFRSVVAKGATRIQGRRSDTSNKEP
jgi:hypothetical protein